MLLTQVPAAAPDPGVSTDQVILVMLAVGGVFTIGLLVLLAFLLRHMPGAAPKKTPPPSRSGEQPAADIDLRAGDTAPDGAKVIKLDD